MRRAATHIHWTDETVLTIRGTRPMGWGGKTGFVVVGVIASLCVVAVFATGTVPTGGGRGGGWLCLFLVFGLCWPFAISSLTVDAWKIEVVSGRIYYEGPTTPEYRALEALVTIERNPTVLRFADGTSWRLPGPADALDAPLNELAERVRTHRDSPSEAESLSSE